jgi:hypothetical protein
VTLATISTVTTTGTEAVLKTTVNPDITAGIVFTRGNQIKIAKLDDAGGGNGAVIDGDFTFEFEKVN